MSYSFGAQGATKAEAAAEAETKFEKVCQDMPVHAHDKDAVLSHMRNLVAIAREPGENEVVIVSMNGYLSASTPTAGPIDIYTVSANCSVSISRKPT